MGWAEGTYRNILADSFKDRWITENPSNTYPRLGYSANLFAALMDRVIEDGTYLRLNNLFTINYDLPIKSKTL